MIPQIDKEIGLSVYTTKYAPISGKIKKNENDFLVKEVYLKKLSTHLIIWMDMLFTC